MIGMVLAGVIALSFTVPAAQPAYADTLIPPSVPTAIQVPAGNKAYFVGHAVGTQNYVCVPSGGTIKFVLLTPVATLFDGGREQLATHYFSPNPSEANADPRVLSNYIIRATWQARKIQAWFGDRSKLETRLPIPPMWKLARFRGCW